jgi:hypothetical protein
MAQMRDAPKGAIYVWPTASSIIYAHDLARRLGRDDLLIRTPSIFDMGAYRLRGTRAHVVLDHAAPEHMSADQADAYHMWAALNPPASAREGGSDE